jgi:hypothetical protein
MAGSVAPRIAAWSRRTGGLPATAPLTSGTPRWNADDTLNRIVELWIDNGWVDITSRVRQSGDIKITRSRGDGQSRVQPKRCSLTLNNADGLFSSKNGSSPYYGKIGKNTPIRVRVGNDIRFEGEVCSFPQRWDTTGRDVWVPLDAGGVLRRKSQGAKPLRYPVPRSILAQDPLHYWPMDDTDGGYFLNSGRRSDTPLVISGSPSMASVVGPSGNGSAKAPQFIASATTYLGGASANINVPVPFTLEMFFKVTETVFGSGLFRLFRCMLSGGSFTEFYGEGVVSSIYPNFDVPNTSTSLTYSMDDVNGGYLFDDEWHHLSMGFTTVGSTIVSIIGIDGHTYGTSTFDMYGWTVGSLVSIEIPGRFASGTVDYTQYMNSMSIAHVAVYDKMLYSAERYDAGYAFNGESAATRFTRLCREERVSATVRGDASTATYLGPQTSAKFLDLLNSIADAEQGLIYEPRIGNGLGLIVHSDTVNTGPGPAIDYDQNHVSGSLEPITDDTNLRNDVSVQRAGGTAVGRFVQTSGPNNVTDSYLDPDGVGTYDESMTLPLYTDQDISSIAGWRVHLGTWDEDRYPTVRVELHRTPFRNDEQLTTSMIGIDVMTRAQLISLPDWLPTANVDLMIQGYAETIGHKTWTLDLVTTPGGPYDIGVWDSSNDRWSPDSAVLAAAVGVSDVTLSVTTSTVRWITSAEDATQFPISAFLEGELISIDAIVGTSLTQTFTVQRGLNGVGVGHGVGAKLRLAHETYWGLG